MAMTGQKNFARIKPEERDMQAVRLRTNEGTFSCLLGDKGRLYTPYVMIDRFPIRKHRMANGSIALYAKPLMKGKNPYPLKRLANHLLRVGRAHGITKSARKFINEAKA